MLSSGAADVATLFPNPAIGALREALLEYHLCFKNPAFSEECEWRLIKMVDVREEFRLLKDQQRDAWTPAIQQRVQALGGDFPEDTDPASEGFAEGIDIKFRSSSRGLIPYVELLIRDPAGVFLGRLPLREVIQGPTPDPELAFESLKMFLDGAGYGSHTRTRVSDIPLRP